MFIKPHTSCSHRFMFRTFLWLSILSSIYQGARCQNVDYSYCKKYISDPIDRADHKDERGLPLLYMGETYDKKYYITTKNFTANFFRAAYNTCARFGLQLATVKTVCEYGIVDKWFLDHFPTDYSVWIAGMRFGFYLNPIWITIGEPLDFSQFNLDVDYIQGPYPPGGYSPIVYPWVNCLSISRNCPIYTSGPTNPCEQTPTYPELQFMWEDCRHEQFRVVCEETAYSKVGMVDLDEKEVDEFEKR